MEHDLNKNKRQFDYWWRANKDHIWFGVALLWCVVGISVFLLLGGVIS